MNERFVAIVRSHARESAPGDKFDTSFADLGITSLGTVQILVEVEDVFDIQFSDDLLTPEIFASPMSLWSAIETLTAGSHLSTQDGGGA